MGGGLLDSTFGSAFQTLANAVRGNAAGASGAYPNAIWSLEIWDEKGPMQGAGYAFAFRWPPSSWNWDQGIRADVSLDLLGKPAVSLLGSGLGRMTLQGSHGVGGMDDENRKNSIGLDHREALRDFYQKFLTVAAKANGEAKPYPQMVIAIRGGGKSEWKNEELSVWPLSFPTDNRDTTRPLDWNYAVTLWVLGSPKKAVSPSLPTIPSVADSLTNLQRMLNKVASVIKFIKNVVKIVRSIITYVKTAVNLIKAIRTTIIGIFRTIRQLIGQFRSLASELKATLNLSTFSKEIKAEIRGIGRELRAINGNLRVMAIQHAGSITTRRSPLPHIAHPLLSLAAQSGNETWQSLASRNRISNPLDATGTVRLMRVVGVSPLASGEVR